MLLGELELLKYNIVKINMCDWLNVWLVILLKDNLGY